MQRQQGSRAPLASKFSISSDAEFQVTLEILSKDLKKKPQSKPHNQPQFPIQIHTKFLLYSYQRASYEI